MLHYRPSIRSSVFAIGVGVEAALLCGVDEGEEEADASGPLWPRATLQGPAPPSLAAVSNDSPTSDNPPE